MYSYIDLFGNITYFDDYGNKVITFYAEDYKLSDNIISYKLSDNISYTDLFCYEDDFQNDFVDDKHDDDQYEDDSYVCDICNKANLSQIQLIKHRIKIHKQF